MRRRQFITLLGAAAAVWSPAAQGQQPAMPVIGYLDNGSPDTSDENITSVRRGLADAGYIEGQNLTVEYRWADDHLERLPALAADLVRRQVALVIAINTPPAAAAKAATRSIPIVFSIGNDPVETGLVESLNKPGGNLTGIYSLSTAVAAKRLELLHELVPEANTIAYLVNLATVGGEGAMREMGAAARALAVRLLVLEVSQPGEFAGAFETLVRERAGALIAAAALFSNHHDQLVALAQRYRVPTIYDRREVTAAGGLMSYGTDFPEIRRQVGVYAGRILNGEKPSALPVQQATKIALSINLKTAKALGIGFPTALLLRADEVIE